MEGDQFPKSKQSVIMKVLKNRLYPLNRSDLEFSRPNPNQEWSKQATVPGALRVGSALDLRLSWRTAIFTLKRGVQSMLLSAD